MVIDVTNFGAGWGGIVHLVGIATSVLKWTTSGSCPSGWELSTFLDNFYFIFMVKIEKIRRLRR